MALLEGVEVWAPPEWEHRNSPGRYRAVWSLQSENLHLQDQEETGPSNIVCCPGACYHGSWARCQEPGLRRREVPKESSRALTWAWKKSWVVTPAKWSNQGERLSSDHTYPGFQGPPESKDTLLLFPIASPYCFSRHPHIMFYGNCVTLGSQREARMGRCRACSSHNP